MRLGLAVSLLLLPTPLFAEPSGPLTTERTVTIDLGGEDFLPVEAPSGELSLAMRFVSPGPVFSRFTSTADFGEIRRRARVRFAAHGAGEDHWPEVGTVAAELKRRAEAFADRHGLELEWVLIEAADQAGAALDDGKADVVALPLAAMGPAALATQGVLAVREVIVGPKGVAVRSPKDLAGREVVGRPSSPGMEALRRAAKGDAKGVRAVAAPETLDDEALIARVERGELPLVVVPEATFLAREPYLTRAAALLPIGPAHPVSWWVRAKNPELKRAIDAFVAEAALAPPVEARFTGDLDGVLARKTLRLLTLNGARTYYVDRGERAGLDCSLALRFAKSLGVALEVIVVPSRAQLGAWLREGRGDIVAAASFAGAPEPGVVASVPYRQVAPVLVGRPGGPGRAVAVAPGIPPALVAEGRPSELEPEELIAAVVSGREALAVVPADAAELELAAGAEVEILERFPPHGLVMSTRSGARRLREALDSFLRGLPADVVSGLLARPRPMLGDPSELGGAVRGQLSPFDHLFRKYGARFGIDWRLSAAQAFAESRFDPKAKSFAGALGLFQVMPRTAASLGCADPTDPEQGAEAGTKYLAQMLARFDPALPLEERLRFALASYNAGYGHVADARRLAAEDGLDPGKWFGHVEAAMKRLEDRTYAARARYGWCRGSEPAKYVAKIQATYARYVSLVAP